MTIYKLRQKLMEQAEGIHDSLVDCIPAKIEAFITANAIMALWRSSGENRRAEVDDMYPLYMKLYLNETDDICKECMLFIETVEEQFNMTADDNSQYNGALKGFSLNEYITLLFMENAHGVCRVITEEVPTEKLQMVTKRRVVCDE